MNCCFFLDEKPRVTFANFLHLFIQGPPLTHSALWQGAYGTLWPFNPLVSPLRAVLGHRHTLSAGSAVFIPTMLIQGRECLLPAGGHRDCLHPVAVMIQIKLKEIQT